MTITKKKLVKNKVCQNKKKNELITSYCEYTPQIQPLLP